MSVVRWLFYDENTSETYEMEINPSEGGSPAYEKNISAKETVAPGGKTVVFEGALKPQELTFSGTILTQEHYTAMATWWQKRHQIRITDDLGRQYWVYVTSFSPRRERAVHYPWKHSYTMTCTILDWPS